MYQPIVAADPDQILLDRGFGDREDGVVILRARIVGCQGLRAGLLLGFVVAAEVRADDGPALAAISRPKQHLAAKVEHVRIMRRDLHRRGPPKAVKQAGWGVSARPKPGRDVPHFAGMPVVAREVAVMIAGVDDLRIAWIGPVVARLAATDRMPLPLANGTSIAAGEDGDAPAVLLRGVN